jgi:hypothetical protein
MLSTEKILKKNKIFIVKIFYFQMISGIDIFLLLSILLSCYGVPPPALVTVTTPLGRIQGSQVPHYDNKILHVFYGVPYAEPPQRCVSITSGRIV